jgi:hypothetical protein
MGGPQGLSRRYEEINILDHTGTRTPIPIGGWAVLTAEKYRKKALSGMKPLTLIP